MKRKFVGLIAAAVLIVVAAVPALGQSSQVLVTDVSPNGGSTDVSAGSNITAAFNMRMDKSTMNNGTFYLKRAGSSTVIPAQVSYRGTTKTATLNPDSALASGVTYTAFVKGGRTGVKGAKGQKLGGTTDRTATFANAKVSWKFTVATPPDTMIDSGPTGTVASRSASFGFSSSKASSSFKCSLDGASFTSCTSPRNYIDLADGSHTFKVRAIDVLGNPDPTPARRSWTVDTTGPNASITDGPPNHVNSRSASFSFSGAEEGGSYQCKIDGASSTGTFSACTSGESFTVEGDGTYTFSVKASDALGNFGTPASRTWTVDTVAPTINDVSPADEATDVAPSADITATFSEAIRSTSVSSETFTLTEQGSTTPIATTVSYDTTMKKATLDPNTNLASNTGYTATVNTGAKDLAGNALAQERSWTFTTGDGPTGVTMTPNPLTFSVSALCPPQSKHLEIINHGPDNVTFAAVSITGPDAPRFSSGLKNFLAANGPGTLQAGHHVFDEVTFVAEGGPPQPRRYEATLTYKDGNGATIGSPVLLTATSSCIVVG